MILSRRQQHVTGVHATSSSTIRADHIAGSGAEPLARPRWSSDDPSITTRLESLLLAGDVTAARNLVMTTYFKPLQAYVGRLPITRALLHKVGCETVEEIVHSFFSERISKDHVMMAWSRGQCPFRAWVRRSMKFYLLTLYERHYRRRQSHLAQLDETQVEGEGDANRVFDLEVRLELCREALRRAGERAAREGRGDEWKAFCLHVCEGRKLETLTNLLRPGRNAKATMRWFRACVRQELREIVSWPGATLRQIDEELCTLLEIGGAHALDDADRMS